MARLPGSPRRDLHSVVQETCSRLGLHFDGKLPSPGSAFKRLSEASKNSRAKPGWLRIFPGGHGGIAGNWRTGEQLPFFAEDWRDGAIDTAEFIARRAALRQAQHVAEIQRRQLAATAAGRAKAIWTRSVPLAKPHAYLERKAVSDEGLLRQLGWAPILLVPATSIDGELRSLQFIAPDGTRRFLRDGDVHGCFCALGLPEPPVEPEQILICEGVATALTLRAASRLPVVCAFSCSNLVAVARNLRQRFPHGNILVCGDDDWQTKRPVRNPGAIAAKKAAEAIAGRWVLPNFKGVEERSPADTDFNDMARQCGLATVERMLVEHLEKSVPDPTDQSQPTIDTFDAIAGRYRSEDGKIFCDGEGGGYMLLANFVAKIVGEVTVDDGVERSKRLEIAWRLHDRSGRFELPAREFAALAWPMDAIGADAIISPGAARRDHLRAAIQYLSGEISKRQIYAQTGWRQHEGRWAYLHNDGAIGGAGLSTELRNGLRSFALPEPPIGEALREAVRASLGFLDAAPDRISCPLFAAVYRAPLQGADFSLMLVGQSGSGKSSIAALAQAHYGAVMWERNTLPADWSSTANALEHLAFQAADAMLVIDEGEAAHGAPNARADLDSKMARILRSVGNQAGRSRMMADGRMATDKAPRSLVIATREEPIEGASLVARTLTLNVMPGEIAGGRGVVGLSPWQTAAASGLYAQALAGYLAWLAEDLPGRRAVFTERFMMARSNLAPRVAHPRTADMLGQLAAAARLFLRFASHANAITNEEAAVLHQRILTGLDDAAGEQSTAQSAADPVEVFVSLLRSGIASGRGHLRGASGERPALPTAYGWRKTDFGYEPQGELVGWIAPDDSLYLLMDAAFASCQRLARETGQSIGVGPTAIRKRIDAKGFILTREGGKRKRLTNRITINGAKVTVLHICNVLTGRAESCDETELTEVDDRTFRTGEGRLPQIGSS
jgi:phage/plasmid primase-like uncharacterized protein